MRTAYREFCTIQADLLERELVQPLMDSDDLSEEYSEKTAGKGLKRLPSSVYWAGLGVWGIRLTLFSQGEYHRRIEETYRRRHTLKALEEHVRARGDDIDPEQRTATLNWHPRLTGPSETISIENRFRFIPKRSRIFPRSYPVCSYVNVMRV